VRVFALPHADAADFVIRNEGAVRPNTVLVEPAPNAKIERQQIRIVQEHHDFAESLPTQEDDFVEHQQPEDDPENQSHYIVWRLRARPDQERLPATAQELDVLQ